MLSIYWVLCYYELIVDEKKDLQSIIDAQRTFSRSLISNDYPDTRIMLLDATVQN
jgi:hypothetical protein